MSGACSSLSDRLLVSSPGAEFPSLKLFTLNTWNYICHHEIKHWILVVFSVNNVYYWGLLNLSVWETQSNLSRHMLPWKFAYRVCTISTKKPPVVVISCGGNVAAAHCYVIDSLPSSSHMIKSLNDSGSTFNFKMSD